MFMFPNSFCVKCFLESLTIESPLDEKLRHDSIGKLVVHNDTITKRRELGHNYVNRQKKLHDKTMGGKTTPRILKGSYDRQWAERIGGDGDERRNNSEATALGWRA